MANDKQNHKNLCEKCGQEVRGVDYVKRSPISGFKGVHWECSACGHLSKTRIVKPK